MSDIQRWHLNGLPGTAGMVEVMLYADHLAAVAAAEERVKSDFAKYLRHMVDDDKFGAGVKAAREAVTAVQAERGYDAAINWSEIGNEYAEGWTDLLSLILPAIDALRGGS